uniref:Uncharacterized protein n=1 Tax=Rhodnius prolixus TaxID=13249 RepID=T1I956_RHOPR
MERARSALCFPVGLISVGSLTFTPSGKACLPQRYVVSFECFLCLVVSYMMRFCLSFTITEMTLVYGAKVDPKSCPYSEEQLNGTKKIFYRIY